MSCRPEEWIGLGFVATIVNAPPEALVEIDGVSSAAVQIAWGMSPNVVSFSHRDRGMRGRTLKSTVVPDWIDEARLVGLLPVGWAWCDARDVSAARLEGEVHAQLVLDLGLEHFIANMEEVYDAHSDVNHPRFHMPDAYCDAFRKRCPSVEFAVTTTPRWASNHDALRAAGAVLMGQAFSLEVPSPPGPATVDACCEFALSWGWTLDRVRPLVQVYETNGEVPAAKPYLDESAEHGVGVVPYILEQALGGQGRELLTALVPAIERAPSATEPEDDMTKIGNQHGVTASTNRLRDLDPGGTLLVKGDDGKWPPISTLPSDVSKWKAFDKLERSLSILVEDHDAAA